MQRIKQTVAVIQAGWPPATPGRARPDWAGDTLRWVQAGAAARAALVVLPALWGCAPLAARLGVPLQRDALLAAAFEARSRLLAETYADVLAAYGAAARAAQVWLVGGSLFEPGPDGAFYHSVPLFSPAGVLRGVQRQTHVPAAQQACGLRPGAALDPLETDLGLLGVLLAEDVTYPEVGRILTLLGATMLVHQGAWREAGQGPWQARLWREVQANQVFGLESALVGGGYRGRATIHAPCEMTPEHSGILAQAAADTGDSVPAATLDFDALAQTAAAYPIAGQYNRALYAQYFPGVYDNREREGRA